MFYPDLFKLHTEFSNKFYDIDFVAYIDNYLGKFDKGTTFKRSDLEHILKNPHKISKLLLDLEKINIIEKLENDEPDEDEEEEYEIISEPLKNIDLEYDKYIKTKREINSFDIIYNKLLQRKSGFFLLLDIKGYSKNINSDDEQKRLLMHYFTDDLKKSMKAFMQNLFFINYGGAIVKQNGDGWLLYFERMVDVEEFLRKLKMDLLEEPKTKGTMSSLGLNLKCYLHYIKEIEKIYRTDTLHFDIEGEEVIYLFLIEKPIEKIIYKNGDSNFVVFTKEAASFISPEKRNELTFIEQVDININDSEGNKKIKRDIEVYYEIL